MARCTCRPGPGSSLTPTPPRSSRNAGKRHGRSCARRRRRCGSRREKAAGITRGKAAMAAQDLLTQTSAGLYCQAGDFFIDPVRISPRALITHGHSDHARPGHGAVMATRETLALMELRYGTNFSEQRQTAVYGETLRIGDVVVSFHP